MLTVSIDARDMERARVLLARWPERLVEVLRRANLNSGAVLLRRVKLALSGEKLHVRTGNLRRNWSQIMPVREPDGWRGGIGSGETEYAAYHEFGFSGSVGVRAHTRRGHAVRAHTRNVSYAGRPYARPALVEVRERIEAIHSDAIRQAWEKSQ